MEENVKKNLYCRIILIILIPFLAMIIGIILKSFGWEHFDIFFKLAYSLLIIVIFSTKKCFLYFIKCESNKID